MYTFLQNLKNRANRRLGNFAGKYTRNIDLYGDRLVQILEKKGFIDQVHLWKEAQNPAYEMEIIQKCAVSRQDQLAYLGCYYAIQFFHLNFRALDVLFLNLASGHDKFDVYKDMQFQIGINFRRLNASYMSKLLDLFFDDQKRPVFAICGVGTRFDLDDLDLGIIDDATDKREELNTAIARMNSEMMKCAIPLHLYLSQYVGKPGFSASIDEYIKLLDSEICDFIIISELLGAEIILGDLELFQKFKNQLTNRYYYKKEGDNIIHEGFLRGILGEVRSLLLQQLRGDILSPKEDAMLMVRSLLYAEKTIFSIKSSNKYEILAELKQHDAQHSNLYNELENALLFFETFRYLYQLLISQDEEIPLTFEENQKNIRIIAENMGYSGIGGVDAKERLLTHYFEYVRLVKEKTEQLFVSVTKHLQSISTFSILAAKSKKIDREKNIDFHPAVEFADLIYYFRGTKFWDDVVITLEDNNCKFLKLLTADLYALPQKARTQIIRRYVAIAHFSFYALLSLLMVISKNAHKLPNKDLVNEINDFFFRSLKGTPDEVRRLAKVFSHYPHLLNEYLFSLDDEKKEKFKKLLETDLWSQDTTVFKKKLTHLTDLHCCTSQYFKRFFSKVVNKYPQYILYLDENDTLKHIANGLLGEVERHADIKSKKDLLGDYFNIEFLRTGLELIQGSPFSSVNREFTDFSDTYMRMLFDVCKMEVEEEWAKKIASHDLLALYVCGGHGREQAFDDDIDVIVILNSEDRELQRYSSKIMSRLNAEIVKRGVLPHYRFSEYNGQYVTLMSELKSILAQKNDCTFIDKAQILGSRRVVGSTIFDELFRKRIIEPFILKQKKSFIREMYDEMLNRHVKKRGEPIQKYNIKECLGGLRDIDMFFLILKAHFLLKEPINDDLVTRLCEIDSPRRMSYNRLKGIFDSLKHLRDIYRLTITADDGIDFNFLDIPAEVLSICKKNIEKSRDGLIRCFETWTGQANRIIKRVFKELDIA